MPPLFPEIEPYASGKLPVGEGHTIYWECVGNPSGEPVVFLHGGPGAGCNALHRRYFNPDHYRILLFDQRGCGRSTPHGSLRDNHTQALIADLEQLRHFLQVESWLVFGGSWGSTLALSYAQAHPEICRALILRGLFLGSQREIDWFLTGMGRFFPEAFADFQNEVGIRDPDALLNAYYWRLTDPNPDIHLPAARAWSLYESRCSVLRPESTANQDSAHEEDAFALAIARMEAHYFVHKCFLTDDQIVRNIDRIRHIPALLIHGRYDVVCPVETAFTLSGAWPELGLQIIADSGHAATEPGTAKALVAATERYRGSARALLQFDD